MASDSRMASGCSAATNAAIRRLFTDLSRNDFMIDALDMVQRCLTESGNQAPGARNAQESVGVRGKGVKPYRRLRRGPPGGMLSPCRNHRE